MFSGAKTDAGEYTNTLAGLRAELRDLTNQQKSVELGTPEYDKLDDRILSLNSNLKSLESAHLDFRRNVGNYPTAEIEAFREKFEQLYGDMQRLVQESNDLQRQLSQKTPGTEEYQALADKLKGVQSELEMAKEAVNEFNVSLKGTPTNFEIKVGDTVRNFNSVKDAVKTLTKELQVMTFEGKNNTKEFDDTITALGRLKTAIKSTGDEVGSYVGNAKGLSDTLEIMQGMAGIAGIGQGLMVVQMRNLMSPYRNSVDLCLLCKVLRHNTKHLKTQTQYMVVIWRRYGIGLTRLETGQVLTRFRIILEMLLKVQRNISQH